MRFHEHVVLPTVITVPGDYRTRCGEMVHVKSVHQQGWAAGNYAVCGIPDVWDVSGRILRYSLSNNDIVEFVS
jgi:hypothetical protein